MNKEELTTLNNRLRRIERLLKNIYNKPLSVKQAAEYTGYSVSHLHKQTHYKRVPYYQPHGKMVFFLRKDLDKFLLQNRVSTREEIEAMAAEFLKIKL